MDVNITKVRNSQIFCLLGYSLTEFAIVYLFIFTNFFLPQIDIFVSLIKPDLEEEDATIYCMSDVPPNQLQYSVN